MAYDSKFVKGAEWLWGEGFLSPGGCEEITEILRGTSIKGKNVLDIGCGIGGIDRLLVTEFNAGKVVAIDVSEFLIERAKRDTAHAGLADQITYRLVQPGSLDFADASFDVIFTKDAILHIQDKRAIYQDIHRVLRDGGVLVGNDWLGSENTDQSELVREWLDFVKFDFHFCTGTQMCELLGEIGFTSVKIRDRNSWYRQAIRDEISKVSGENRMKFIEVFGEEMAETRLRSSELKMKVVDAGELRPTIFRAIKS